MSKSLIIAIIASLVSTCVSAQSKTSQRAAGAACRPASPCTVASARLPCPSDRAARGGHGQACRRVDVIVSARASRRYAQTTACRDYARKNEPTSHPRRKIDCTGLVPRRHRRLLPSASPIFGASTHVWQTEADRRRRFLVCAWRAVYPTGDRGRLRHARAVGSDRLSLRRVTCGPVDHGNSTGLRDLCSTYDFVVAGYLMTVTARGTSRQARPLLLGGSACETETPVPGRDSAALAQMAPAAASSRRLCVQGGGPCRSPAA